MPNYPIDLLKQLREMTGAGMMDCRSALEEAEGDLDKGVKILREKGMAKAAKKAGRPTSNGVVEAYLHATGDYPPQKGSLLELNCETDFVAKGEDFRNLARELALQIVASEARWISREEVPSEVVEQELAIYRAQAEQDGTPPAALEKRAQGRLEGFFKETCLLEQPYVREPKRLIKDLLSDHIARLQENITVRRFCRFNIKEA